MPDLTPTTIVMLRTYDRKLPKGKKVVVPAWLAQKLCQPAADDGGPFAALPVSEPEQEEEE